MANQIVKKSEKQMGVVASGAIERLGITRLRVL